MPKHTMGGRADAGADAMVHEASKRCVQAPVQVSPTLEQVTPLPRHLPPLPQPVVNVDGDDDEEEVAALAPQTEQVSPLPWVTPPVPEPVVAGDVNKDDPQPGVHLPRMLPSLPPPVVVADENEEEFSLRSYCRSKVLSDDVDSDQETQRIYRRQKVRELNSGVLEKRIRPRIRRGATDALTATS
ncbi:unnamed protein product [Triticum turgidum subsp. durum]|uniref:Uncharacterized protein n=1 Tax=Triticum turgidum subsp. durum TaxID=4567 RepID=A0A9R0VT26_TRITD|nr:unnamed protein product [Triticum turgidum subsp. durum]